MRFSTVPSKLPLTGYSLISHSGLGRHDLQHDLQWCLSHIPGSRSYRRRQFAADLRDMLFFLRMRWHWIVATTIAFLAIAGTYLLTAEPTYVASTQLVIFPQVSGSEAQRAFAEDAFIEGQLEIARSSDVVGGTVAALDLVHDPEFVDQTPSLQDRAKNWLMGLSPQVDTPSQDAAGKGASEAQPQTEDERLHDWATAKLLNMMDIRRIGSSTIIEISAAASTPQKAVDIADTLAGQYIQKNIAMKANAARQYSDWLAKFIAEQQRGSRKPLAPWPASRAIRGTSSSLRSCRAQRMPAALFMKTP